MISKDKPLRALFVNPFGIGDVLCTTPVLRAFKDAYPESFVGYWCNERAQDILKNNRCVDKIFPLSRGDLKKIFRKSFLKGCIQASGIFKAIRREKFDLVFDFSLDHRYGLAQYLCGIKKRIGFDYKGRGRFLTDKIPLESYKSKHIVEYYFDLLKPLEIRFKPYPMEFPFSQAAQLRVKEILNSCGITESDSLIGLFPGGGASWGKDAASRLWPARNFAQVADMAVDEFRAKIIILGDNSEKGLAAGVAAAMKNRAVDLAGKFNLEELAALLSKLMALVSNDGGPMHMAKAAGINTVSIFGPVDELVYGPYPPGDKSIVIKEDLDCRPCYRNFRLPACLVNRQCINNILPVNVFEGLRRLLCRSPLMT